MHKVYVRDTILNPAAKQREGALAGGTKERDIWEEGKGGETFNGCVAAYRSGGGTLGLVGGLAVLADNRKDMMERVRYLTRHDVCPCDQDSGGTLRRYDEHGGDLVDEAMRKINGSKAMKMDRKRPSKIGRKGGKAKGEKARERRFEKIADDVLTRLLLSGLSVRKLSEILGEGFSVATVSRLIRELRDK